MCEESRQIQKNPLTLWKQSKPTQNEITLLKQECETHSIFDPLKLRYNTWKNYKSGKYKMKCSECDLAKIISIVPANIEPPLDDWGYIFQWLGPSKQGKWTIFWLGAAAKREFPEKGLPIDSRHLNGGYTIPCSSNGIFIYRIEEVTRVLMHELLHAACLDPHIATLPFREATIEAWAELFLIAHRSKGDLATAEHLWKLQSQWVADTNYKAEKDNNVRGQNDYGWRYLNGRAQIFHDLGIELPVPHLINGKASLRFTHPALD